MIDQISQVMYLPLHPRLPGRFGRRVQLLALLLSAGAVSLAFLASPARAGQDRADRRLQQRLDEANRREAEVLVNLVDSAAAGEPVPSDFSMSWRHDFLKAEVGTFVPFVLTIEGTGRRAGRALMYVRAARRREPESRPPASERGRGRQERYAFDAIFPVAWDAGGGRIRIARGFSVPAGEYDIYVALRERSPDVGAPEGTGATDELRAGVLRRSLSVPDFWSGEFATSTVMLAERIELLARPLSADEALERPYVIGLNDVRVAFDSTFRQDGELIVVFVIYNPTLAPGGDFDVQVDYHVFRRAAAGQPDASAAREGERYITRTDPQRFNRRTLGPGVEVDGEHPMMAGQGILLSSLDPGEYRLGITVIDLLSGQKLARDVIFRIAGS